MRCREKVIDGILCRMASRNGEWMPVSREELTRMVSDMRQEIGRLKNKTSARGKRSAKTTI